MMLFAAACPTLVPSPPSAVHPFRFERASEWNPSRFATRAGNDEK
jgi:hypothetical protein